MECPCVICHHGEGSACRAHTRAVVVSHRCEGPEARQACVQRGIDLDGKVSSRDHHVQLACVHMLDPHNHCKNRNTKQTHVITRSLARCRRYKPTYDGGADVGDHVVIVNTKVRQLNHARCFVPFLLELHHLYRLVIEEADGAQHVCQET